MSNSLTMYDRIKKINTQEWETPKELFEPLNNEFHFTLDVCATQINTKCKKFFSESVNGLIQNWNNNICFCNPPFNQALIWSKKCLDEGNKPNTITVLIIYARTDTKYWHENIMKAYEIRFCVGRINFELNGVRSKSNSTFPTAIIIFKKHDFKNPICSSYNFKKLYEELKNGSIHKH